MDEALTIAFFFGKFTFFCDFAGREGQKIFSRHVPTKHRNISSRPSWHLICFPHPSALHETSFEYDITTISR